MTTAVVMGKKPESKVLVSRENVARNNFTEVGLGWNATKDGSSIQLNGLPVDGKLVLFPRGESQ